MGSKEIPAIKKRLGVPEALQSRHTAGVEATGEVIEGHVPTPAVAELMASRSTKGVVGYRLLEGSIRVRVPSFRIT
ncbi:DUF411 domain-containing protein [Herbaspirillum huttiense]|uniref:DUF411 domain-containing protein n=1 Tax=Herbaspirillum huttiense TaxID=863372 RepID=UPI003817F943